MAKVGILGAMYEEVFSIKQLMVVERETQIGGRNYIEGKINSTEVVLTFSRWGKVAASSTVTTLIVKFNVDQIVFTGVAGAVHPMLNIGDIVIGDGHYQHDMDARPLFPKYQIPLTNTLLFQPNKVNLKMANIAAHRFIQKMNHSIDTKLLETHQIFQPIVYQGMIASGDKFIANPGLHSDLSYEIEGKATLAVEMEGAAIAQVCHEHDIPYVIIRTISDKADHSAEIDFQSFVCSIANQYSAGILAEYFNEWEFSQFSGQTPLILSETNFEPNHVK